MMNLINEYKNGNIEVFEQISKQYDRLIYKIINKYPTTVTHTKEDKHQIAMISLIKALDSFDPSKDLQFITLLGTIVRNDMNMTFRYTQKRDAIVNSLDEKLGDDSDDGCKIDTMSIGNNVEEHMDSIMETEFMEECLREYKVKYAKKYESAYLILNGMTQRETSKVVGVCRTQCQNNYNHFIKFAKEKAIKDGLLNN